jgi:hypothetical protein
MRQPGKASAAQGPKGRREQRQRGGSPSGCGGRRNQAVVIDPGKVRHLGAHLSGIGQRQAQARTVTSCSLQESTYHSCTAGRVRGPGLPHKGTGASAALRGDGEGAWTCGRLELLGASPPTVRRSKGERGSG